MNQQKDLIQHIAVLTVAPSHLNFSMPRSSGIMHIGLQETTVLMRDCLRIMAAEDRRTDVFRCARDVPALAPYALAFRETTERISGLIGQVWEDDLDVRCAVEPVISDLDAFLSAEHWYDMSHAWLIRSADGSFYSDRSPRRVNFVSNWQCASLFFSDEVTSCVCEALHRHSARGAEPVPLLSLAPPDDYLWMARTYAPQTPQNLINYWEAMLPGARRARIRQMVSQQQSV